QAKEDLLFKDVAVAEGLIELSANVVGVEAFTALAAQTRAQLGQEQLASHVAGGGGTAPDKLPDERLLLGRRPQTARERLQGGSQVAAAGKTPRQFVVQRRDIGVGGLRFAINLHEPRVR